MIQAAKSYPRVFISHASVDKPFVQKLVADLKDHNQVVWFDQEELKPGDSIVQGISDGLKDSDYLVVVLSEASVRSKWVQAELNAALMSQLSDKGTVVLPVLIEDVEIPTLLRDRLYADFRRNYNEGLQSLLRVFAHEIYSGADLGLLPFGQCPNVLSKLRLADLRRRMTRRMRRPEVGVIWFDVFGSSMDNDMQNRELVDCVIALLERADQRNKLSELYEALCFERADSANA